LFLHLRPETASQQRDPRRKEYVVRQTDFSTAEAVGYLESADFSRIQQGGALE
jgi:hypothetical protein